MNLIGYFLTLCYCVTVIDTSAVLHSSGGYDKFEGPCIFGDSDECYFRCNCAAQTCSPDDRKCQSCHPFTGQCLQGCRQDNLTEAHYSIPYWSGPGCQVGDIARGKPSRFEDGTVNGALYFTDGSFEYANRITFQNPEYWLIDLKVISKVIFVDFVIKPQSREFKDNLRVSLVTQSNHNYFVFQNITKCVQRNANRGNKLVKPFPHKLLRVHYTCAEPSVGNIIKVKTRKNIHLPFTVSVSEVVVIGHRHIPHIYKPAITNQSEPAIKTIQWPASCLKPTSDSDQLQWCIQCNNSYPPLCTQTCATGKHGVNCVTDDITEIQAYTETIAMDTTEISNDVIANSSEYPIKPVIVLVNAEEAHDDQKVTADNVKYNQPFFTVQNIVVISIFSCVILFILLIFLVWYKLRGSNDTKGVNSGVDARCGSTVTSSDTASSGEAGSIPLTELLHLDTSPPPAPPALRSDSNTHQYCEIDEIATPTECLLNRASIGGTGRSSAMGLSKFPYNSSTIAPVFGDTPNKHYSLPPEFHKEQSSDPDYLCPVSSKLDSSYLSIIAGSTEQMADSQPVADPSFVVPQQGEGQNDGEKDDGYLEPKKCKGNDYYLVPQHMRTIPSVSREPLQDGTERAHSVYDNLL